MNDDLRLANAFIAYVATLLFLGVSAITTLNLAWYRALSLPAWMPSDALVGIVWALLFVLTAWSACIVWNTAKHGAPLRAAATRYMVNGLLVLLWNYLFFGLHMLLAASVVALLVGVSVLDLMIRVRRISKNASLMLAPYLAWMLLALGFCYVIWTLNP